MREPIGVYTAKTFGWMALGLVVTFAVAFFIDVTPLVFILYGNGILPFILLIAELIVVGVLSAARALAQRGRRKGAVLPVRHHQRRHVRRRLFPV